MRKPNKVATDIDASHPNYERLIEDVLRRADLIGDRGPAPYLAHVILDYPLTWAIRRLEGLDSVLRARTLVATQATHPAYLDCIGSYHVSGVVCSTDEPALLSGVYAAATAQRTYQWRSGLTYMELRVTRALLRGLDTRGIAASLSISTKTVNAHVSNILCKSGAENRAQYVAQLLGDAADTANPSGGPASDDARGSVEA
jgi:DNA-binding CsgD family transcriptional regulator